MENGDGMVELRLNGSQMADEISQTEPSNPSMYTSTLFDHIYREAKVQKLNR